MGILISNRLTLSNIHAILLCEIVAISARQPSRRFSPYHPNRFLQLTFRSLHSFCFIDKKSKLPTLSFQSLAHSSLALFHSCARKSCICHSYKKHRGYTPLLHCHSQNGSRPQAFQNGNVPKSNPPRSQPSSAIIPPHQKLSFTTASGAFMTQARNFHEF